MFETLEDRRLMSVFATSVSQPITTSTTLTATNPTPGITATADSFSGVADVIHSVARSVGTTQTTGSQ